MVIDGRTGNLYHSDQNLNSIFVSRHQPYSSYNQLYEHYQYKYHNYTNTLLDEYRIDDDTKNQINNYYRINNTYENNNENNSINNNINNINTSSNKTNIGKPLDASAYLASFGECTKIDKILLFAHQGYVAGVVCVCIVAAIIYILINCLCFYYYYKCSHFYQFNFYIYYF